MRDAIALLCASLLLFPASEVLSDEDSTSGATWTSPQNLSRLAPRYPQPHLAAEQSGWVDISLVVSADGETTDLIVVDAVGGREFEEAALEAVSGFRYEPATRGGAAVDGSPDVAVISFTVGDLGLAPRRPFLRRYNRDMRRLEQGMIDDTTRSLDRVRTESSNFGELRLTNIVLAERARQMDDPHGELMYLKRADVDIFDSLRDETHASVLAQLIDLELRLNRYADAFENWAKLEALETRGDTADLALRIDEARRVVAEQGPIIIPAEIRNRDQCVDCRGPWWFRPTYREFAIVDILGTIDKVDVRCEANRLVSANVESTIWELDDAWGKCVVLVFGEADTSFSVAEAPNLAIGDPG